MTVSVCIPTIPGREDMLARAVQSVIDQDRPADEIIIVQDKQGRGAWWTRTQAMYKAESKYIAFLDDDDELLSNHLDVLVEAAEETGADLVYSRARRDPMPNNVQRWYDRKPDPQTLLDYNYIPVTYLVRTETALTVGGFPDVGAPDAEDWAWLRMLVEHGIDIHHVPVITWIWNKHDNNTAGRSWPGHSKTVVQ